MKIISNTYKFEKICTGTLEFELNETDPTFLYGRSGGSSYVAAFYPNWIDEYTLHGDNIVKSDKKILSGFLVISSTYDSERRGFLSVGSLLDWKYICNEIKPFPHGEDILNWFTSSGENYTHEIITKKLFLSTIRKWCRIK